VCVSTVGYPIDSLASCYYLNAGDVTAVLSADSALSTAVTSADVQLFPAN